MTGTFTPNILRQRTVGGTPECKVQFPTAELATMTLSNLHEIKAHNKESSKGKRCQQDDDSPYSAIPTHMDVWLPSAIFRTWTTGRMSRVLMVDEGDGVGKVRPVGFILNQSPIANFSSPDVQPSSLASQHCCSATLHVGSRGHS